MSQPVNPGKRPHTTTGSIEPKDPFPEPAAVFADKSACMFQPYGPAGAFKPKAATAFDFVAHDAEPPSRLRERILVASTP